MAGAAARSRTSLFPQSDNYNAIQIECIRDNKLWEDPDFPATTASLFTRSRKFEWKRPHEICDNPVFIREGISRFDVVQGVLGDCWLLAAVANVTLNQELVNRIIPMDPPQTFAKECYFGAFRFCFWHYGEWVEVIVDDRLPTSRGRLAFLHSADNNEFWSALLEKAYAKLVGSYENAQGGSICESMTDFTGGFCETIDLREKAPKNLLQILLKAFERRSLMGCSIAASSAHDSTQFHCPPRRTLLELVDCCGCGALLPGGGFYEQRLENGLVVGHAYSITSVKRIKLPSDSRELSLVRIRNPWGNAVEWNGAWSDNSQEWKLLSDAQRKELGLTFDSDGEFWMGFQDFVTNFETLDICHICLDSANDDESKGRFKWQTKLFEGEWRKQVNAGGCSNFHDTFWTNPQYRITVTDPDENDDENLCTLLVGLLQKDRRKQRTESFQYLDIGFALFPLQDPNCGPLDKAFFERNQPAGKTTFFDSREVCSRFKIKPGHYCLIPSTYETGHEGEFVIRIYTEKPNNSNEIDDKTAVGSPDFALPPPTPSEASAFDEAHSLFRKISGTDAQVDVQEFMDILNKTFAKGSFSLGGSQFGLKVSHIFSLEQHDASGKLGEAEFSEFWEELRTLKNCFQEFDKDHSGYLQSIELREALKACGFRVNNQLLKALITRFSDKDGKLDFNRYVSCAVRLKAMASKIQNASGRGEALTASMSLDMA